MYLYVVLVRLMILQQAADSYSLEHNSIAKKQTFWLLPVLWIEF